MPRLRAPFLLLTAGLLAASPRLTAMSGSVPAGLPSHFAFGSQSFPSGVGGRTWMDNTKASNNAAWDLRYTYLNAGVNTGSGWATWNSPAGTYASLYMSDSDAGGYLPVFVYYQMLQSSPASGADESSKDYNNLNNSSTMNAYYADFKLLMQKAAAFNKTVVVHIEPDLFGYMQKDHCGGTNNAANCPAAVASSGFADVSGLPNTFQGYCRALRKLRDSYAPKVRLAMHLSMWATARDLMADTTLTQANIDTEVDKTVGFLNSCDSGTEGNFDLFFFEFSDRDASYKWSTGNSTYWWSDTATNIGGSPSTFSRHRYIINRVSDGLGLRGMGWQVPIGNTVYLTCNNATKHWRSPFAQAILSGYSGPAAATKVKAYADSGAIGMLFGAGATDQTHGWDDAGDGTTNGANVSNYGSTQGTATSTVSDDDGGYLRVNVGAYYTAGSYPLVGVPSPSPTSTPTLYQSPTATPTATPDCPRAFNLLESLTENGSWSGSGASRSLSTNTAALTQGNSCLLVQVSSLSAWWNESVANLGGFSPAVFNGYSGISVDVYVDPAAPPWSGSATVHTLCLDANAAAANKWSQAITADVAIVPGMNHLTLPFNFALGSILATDTLSALMFNLKVDSPATGNFYVDNIVLHTGGACPPSPTPSASPSPSRTATPTRTPSATPSASPSASASASPSASPSSTPTRTPSGTPSASASVTPTSSPSASATASATRSSTATVTATATPSGSATRSASPSPSASPSASPSRTATASATATASPSASPSATASATRTGSPTATPSRTASASATASPSASPTATLSPVLSPTATATPSASATATPTASATASATASFSASPSPSASPTATATPSASSSASPSATASASPTASPTASDSATSSQTPSATPTATASLTATESPVLSPTPTATASPTDTATGTLTVSPTDSASPSASPSPSATPSASPSASATPSATDSATPSLTGTDGPTASASPSASASASPSATASRTPSRTATPSLTLSPTPTWTPSLGPSASRSPSPSVTPSASPVPTAAPGNGQGGKLKQAVALPNPQRQAQLAVQGPRFSLRLEGQPGRVKVDVYSRAFVRVGGWEQALWPNPAAESWQQLSGPPMELAVGAYFVRFSAEGSVVRCNLMVLP